MKSFKIPKVEIKAIIQRTDNTIAKNVKRQIMVDNIHEVHRKLSLTVQCVRIERILIFTLLVYL